MSTLSAFVAKVGVNPYWIAFNAHFWFAAFLVLAAGGARWAFYGVIIAAALKEFWFDAKYEVPKQTSFDNWSDFAGYALGAMLGGLVA